MIENQKIKEDLITIEKDQDESIQSAYHNLINTLFDSPNNDDELGKIIRNISDEASATLFNAISYLYENNASIEDYNAIIYIANHSNRIANSENCTADGEKFINTACNFLKIEKDPARLISIYDKSYMDGFVVFNKRIKKRLTKLRKKESIKNKPQKEIIKEQDPIIQNHKDEMCVQQQSSLVTFLTSSTGEYLKAIEELQSKNDELSLNQYNLGRIIDSLNKQNEELLEENKQVKLLLEEKDDIINILKETFGEKESTPGLKINKEEPTFEEIPDPLEETDESQAVPKEENKATESLKEIVADYKQSEHELTTLKEEINKLKANEDLAPQKIETLEENLSEAIKTKESLFKKFIDFFVKSLSATHEGEFDKLSFEDQKRTVEDLAWTQGYPDEIMDYIRICIDDGVLSTKTAYNMISQKVPSSEFENLINRIEAV